MSTRFYPIYQLGNPQLRVFLPNFWMKLVKPEEPQPPNVVQFITHTGMTNYDIRNYLEKIYNVRVVHVRSYLEDGKIRPAMKHGYLIKEDDFRRAYVTLPRDVKFEFPALESEKKKAEDIKEREQHFENMKQMNRAFVKTKKGRVGIPPWFQI
ncbi:large ribosomal subunit protein uL23m [Planococcus citri]|uniref:large ribosomal subunit protein uL23m n=1 Tax=Planococcus citri TaxID=170843 RepID=UPI0031F90DFB